jgi:diadenylate cyclase
VSALLEWLGARAAALWSFLVANFELGRDTIDIVLVSVAIYYLLLLIRGTRAVQVLVGLGALISLRLVADTLDLLTISWILDNFLASAVLIIIVLFQADIRRALARMGGFLPRLTARQESQVLEEVVRACHALSQRRIGALIALERETGLDDVVSSGAPLDAVVSKDLLFAIFLRESPMHDGAAVIRHGRVALAGAILPLSGRTELPAGLGTRHRAALGLSEETDAVVIVVSEESGGISLAVGGELSRDLDAARLRRALRERLTRKGSEAPEPRVEPEAASAVPRQAGDA